MRTTTKFRVLEFSYIVTTFIFLFYVGIYIGTVVIIPTINEIDFADFLNLFLIPAAAIIAIIIGYCATIKLLSSTLLTYYRQSIAQYTDASYPQEFPLASTIGIASYLLIPLIISILAYFTKQSVENGIKLYLYILNYCSIISVCLIPVMLLTSYFARHYRRIQPPQAPRDR